MAVYIWENRDSGDIDTGGWIRQRRGCRAGIRKIRDDRDSVFGEIKCNGFICLATHNPDREKEGRHWIRNWIFYRVWREGGVVKY